MIVSEHVQYVSLTFSVIWRNLITATGCRLMCGKIGLYTLYNATHLQWENLPINSSRETIIISAVTSAHVKLISEGHQWTEGVDVFAEPALHKIIGICGQRCWNPTWYSSFKIFVTLFWKPPWNFRWFTVFQNIIALRPRNLNHKYCEIKTSQFDTLDFNCTNITIQSEVSFLVLF